jgi:hypothetical protein
MLDNQTIIGHPENFKKDISPRAPADAILNAKILVTRHILSKCGLDVDPFLLRLPPTSPPLSIKEKGAL